MVGSKKIGVSTMIVLLLIVLAASAIIGSVDAEMEFSDFLGSVLGEETCVVKECSAQVYGLDNTPGAESSFAEGLILLSWKIQVLIPLPYCFK
ncbi:hypothetical protein Sjap_012906 [Stephania japonica]|uniref:Uncharacterized protein n=1 Tax=Stephania japonica TaxID=461633 RepID=A0AAP0IWY9_9MAGN